MPNQCNAWFPNFLQHGFSQRNLQIKKKCVCIFKSKYMHQNMPLRSYEHHLAAFCRHNSPFKCGTLPDWFSVRDVPSEETVWNNVATNRRIMTPFLPRGKGRTGDIDTAVELRTGTKKVVQDTFPRFIFCMFISKNLILQPPTSFKEKENSVRHANSVQRSNMFKLCEPGGGQVLTRLSWDHQDVPKLGSCQRIARKVDVHPLPSPHMKGNATGPWQLHRN